MSKVASIDDFNKIMKEEIPISPTTAKKEGAIGIFSRLLRLDALSGRSSASTESPPPVDPLAVYYGVYIPCEIKKGPDEEALHVYTSKTEALELVRRYKQARFKAFSVMQDALAFALRGADIPESNDGADSMLMGEKPYPFKSLSTQDMVALRQMIEAGLLDRVRDCIWDNPRHLVSNGNTPGILQEGSRYNALHVAAKAMNAEMCNLILTTVGNPVFVGVLYGMDAEADCCKEFAAILLDRYLNTPDKAMNETPLHFASKFGSEEVVEVLTSFPQCNKEAVNKYGQTPKDVICMRSLSTDRVLMRRIANLMGSCGYYVPVLHSEDDSMVPTIGQPFTPATPPNLSGDPMSPRCEIRAFAGPMEASDAAQFRRRWKTPPRNQRQGLLSPAAFRLKEMTKGLESVGRNLAEEMKVGWKEYWPFLDTFTDFRTAEGLALLENYLKDKFENAHSLAYNESLSEASPDELSLSRISLSNRSIEKSPNKDNTLSPITDLCMALKTCNIGSDRHSNWRRAGTNRRLSRDTQKLLVNHQNGELQSPSVNHTVSQLLCIERTCQVFAKRIADALIFSLTAEPEVAGESLKAEARHLQHTIFSYMDDVRFQAIDFALIHSRLTQLVVYKLSQQTKELDDINALVVFLIKLRCPNDDIFSSDDERKTSYRSSNRSKKSVVIDSHVRCLASFISEALTEGDTSKGPSMTEEDCTKIWDQAVKCSCEWKVESLERNSKKNSSFKRKHLSRSLLSTSPKNESFIKKLDFEQDMGDGRLKPPTPPDVNANSPGGDAGPEVAPSDSALATLNVDKCSVLTNEMMSDDEDKSSGDESYHTASDSEDDDDKMADASDTATVDTFIYGEEPTKMDRLVFDAMAEANITPEEFPNIYKWQHTIALYSPTERNKWQPKLTSYDSVNSSITYSLNFLNSPLANSPKVNETSFKEVSRSSPLAVELSSTPKKSDAVFSNDDGRSTSLQMSNWLRITGPNSPRSALSNKNVGHNVSFGF